MKKFYLLIFLLPHLNADLLIFDDLNIKVFNSKSIDLVNEMISSMDESNPPNRTKWMKSDEYEDLLYEYHNNLNNTYVFFAIPIHLATCDYWTQNNKYVDQSNIIDDPIHPSCFDVDKEVFYLNKPNKLNSNHINLNKNIDKNEDQYFIKMSFDNDEGGTSIDVRVINTSYKKLEVSNVDLSFHEIKAPLRFEFIKNNFNSFNLYALVKINISPSSITIENFNEQLPTEENPLKKNTTNEIIKGEFSGYFMTFKGKIFSEIGTISELNIKSKLVSLNNEVLFEGFVDSGSEITYQTSSTIPIPKVKFIAGGSFVKDSEYIPVIKIQPTYPSVAQRRGIMGYAVIEFDIEIDGTVSNAVPVKGYCTSKNPNDPEAQFRPCSIFNSASSRAALKLIYKPKIVDGKAVRVEGVQHKFTFIIEGF